MCWKDPAYQTPIHKWIGEQYLEKVRWLTTLTGDPDELSDLLKTLTILYEDLKCKKYTEEEGVRLKEAGDPFAFMKRFSNGTEYITIQEKANEMAAYRNRTYDLMNKNIKLGSFRFKTLTKDPAKTIRIYEDSTVFAKENIKLFPYLLRKNCTAENLELWLDKRPLPLGRKHYHEFLLKYDLVNRCDFLIHGFGMGLNDCFWIKNTEFNYKWEDINFYKNGFTTKTSELARGNLEYTGNSPEVVLLNAILSSPDLTTGGILEKFWKLEDGQIYLYKIGKNEGASEIIVSNLLDVAKIDHIKYGLVTRNRRNRLVGYSKCKLFTNEEIGHVSFWEVYYTEFGTTKLVQENITKLYGKYLSDWYDMILVDYLVRNTDRHMRNYGFLINNCTGDLIKPFPLFDHGLSFYPETAEEIFDDDGKFNYKALPKETDMERLFNDILDERRLQIVKDVKQSLLSGTLSNVLTNLVKEKQIDRGDAKAAREWIEEMCDKFLNWKHKPFDSEFSTTVVKMMIF